MDISKVALDRMLEMEYHGKRTNAGTLKKTLSNERRKSDDELMASLAGIGIALDREAMIRFTEEFVSAQEISESLIDKGKLDEDQAHDAWLALTVLWERWLPEKPSLEGIDDWMQKGYEHAGKGDSAGACRAWLIAWKSILEILDKRSIKTLDEFDDLFQGTQSAFNWVQDFEMELGNAGIDEKDFLLDRISLCTEYENRFGSKDGLTAENMRRALAESYFKLGEREKADALFG
jgi:hypothetical protein